MARSVKTAIAMPREDFRLVEAIRKETGKSRSQIFVEALHAWLAQRRFETIDAQYEESYRKKPENIAEIENLAKVSSPVWGKEEW